MPESSNYSLSEPLLRVEQLKVYFPILGGVFRRKIGEVKAVDDVSFAVQRGQTVGLVGESGSGKTTVGRAIIRLTEADRGNDHLRRHGDFQTRRGGVPSLPEENPDHLPGPLQLAQSAPLDF